MSLAAGLRRILPWSVVMLVVGGIGGLLWVWLAQPAEWEVTTQGVTLDEDAARGQFAVVVTFVVIGAGLCLAWGLVAGRSLRELGWLLVPVFAVAAGAAGVVAWRVGVALGPADPREAVRPAIGDRLPSPLEIDAVAPFLIWPMFALIGLLVVAWLDRSDVGAADDAET